MAYRHLLEANGGGDNKILKGNLTNALAGTSPTFTTLFSDTNTLDGQNGKVAVEGTARY